ncbi:MAG TPA: sulfate permease [Propionibacterium sp.]|nr:sulfate permease [Propionibacterium sp.]
MVDAGGPGWERFLPGLSTLRHYDRSWLRGDLLAGLTVTAYLVPQVMAYAVIAGLPPVVGLWGMLGPLAVYAVVGTSRQLSVGPEATTSLMAASALGAVLSVTDAHLRLETAGVLAILVGLVCVVGWLLRLGFLANLLSRPVMQGYLVGVAVLMVASQLGKVTKVGVRGDLPLDQFLSLAGQWRAIHVPTLLVATLSLVLILALRRWLPRWPAPLIAVMAAAAFVALPVGQGLGLATIGDVPVGLPPPNVPSFAGVDVVRLLPWAVGIALVGYSDNVLTARAFASRRRERIDANQELLALGATNLVAGLTSGFPNSSSSSRTVLGDSMGSRTQLHALVVLAGVVLVLLVAAPALATFPTAAMGALIVYAASRLVDVPELVRIARFRRSELVLATVTAVGVVGLGVLSGIGVAVVVSLLDLIRRIATPHDAVLGYQDGLAGMHDVDDYPEATQVEGLVVYRYDAPLFFVNSNDYLTRALAAVDAAAGPVRWMLLNLETAVEIDLTAADALVELQSALAERGITLALSRVKWKTREFLANAGLLQVIESDHVFPTLPTAVAAYEADFVAEHGRPPGRRGPKG